MLRKADVAKKECAALFTVASPPSHIGMPRDCLPLSERLPAARSGRPGRAGDVNQNHMCAHLDNKDVRLATIQETMSSAFSQAGNHQFWVWISIQIEK